MLYQLSYASGFVFSYRNFALRELRIGEALLHPRASWHRYPQSGRRDSNPRHQAWKASALPTELLPHNFELRTADNRIHKKIQPSNNGGGRIRTFVGVSRQIYSLLPLATRAPHRFSLFAEYSFVGRADGENRTPNLLITNQLLCQLSYVSNKQRFFIASLVE